MTNAMFAAPAATTVKRPRPLWHGHVRSVVSWILFGTFAALFMSFRPVMLGGTTTYAFVTGVSMLPVLHTGDLAVLEPAQGYGLGDIVAYKPGPEATGAIIHRIVGGSAANGFVVKGDNKPEPDAILPRPADILGRAVIILPSLGWVLATIRNPAILAMLAALVAVSTFWDWRDSRASGLDEGSDR